MVLHKLTPKDCLLCIYLPHVPTYVERQADCAHELRL